MYLMEYASLKADDEDHSGGGTALSRVAVASDAKPAEVWAADKLARMLSLPLVRLSMASPAAAVAQIAVGYGAATALGASPSALAPMCCPDEAKVVVVSISVTPMCARACC